MRLLVILATILLIPAYAVILEWVFEWRQKPVIEARCRKWLDDADLRSVTVSLNHFDALLSGVCPDPNGRDKAQKIISRIRGIRVKEGNNRIETPARLTARFDQRTISISGWVDSEQTRRQLLDVVKQFRPDLNADAESVRVSPHIVMGKPVTLAVGTVPESISTFLETVRAPSSLSITPENGTLRMRGFLPSTSLREQVVDALRGKPGQWKLATNELNATEHVAPAAFTKDHALSAFLKSYYDTPDPGIFSIDSRKGPQLKAFATPEMVTRWLALLLPVSGSSHVPLEGITYLPSVYHFPNYKPTSELPPGTDVGRLRALLKNQQLYFASGSSSIEPAEQVKLGSIVFAINDAGPGARFIVAGYADIGGETASYKGVIQGLRATAVKKMLLRMGVTNPELEVQAFEVPRPNGTLTNEHRRESRRVEILLK